MAPTTAGAYPTAAFRPAGSKVRGHNGSGPRFVLHAELPPTEAYEGFIARTGRVPTRDNLHDFFNGLMWLSYPATKRRMNELQAHEIATRGASGHEGLFEMC